MTLPEGVLAKGRREEYEDGFDGKLVEFQTDKPMVKICACTECGALVAVNVFYAPAICKCTAHGGGGERRERSPGEAGSQAVVQPGRTDPEKAANLADCLINRQFANANCPLCSEPMELKNVSHNPNYGPRHLLGYDKAGSPQYKQQTGETVLLQCNHCKTVLGMSTSHTAIYRRQNEPKPSSGRESGWVHLLGTREEVA